MDEEPSKPDPLVVEDMKGYCPKATDGKHKWKPYHGGSRCEHCEGLSEKRQLFG